MGTDPVGSDGPHPDLVALVAFALAHLVLALALLLSPALRDMDGVRWRST
jgi:hypothetical protein